MLLLTVLAGTVIMIMQIMHYLLMVMLQLHIVLVHVMKFVQQKAVLMENLIVVMDLAYMVHGNVMDGLIVQMVQMKQTVQLQVVKIKVMLIVETVSVFMIAGYVMAGVTAQMDQMKQTVK